jgi:hypothetical protein
LSDDGFKFRFAFDQTLSAVFLDHEIVTTLVAAAHYDMTGEKGQMLLLLELWTIRPEDVSQSA